MRVFKINDIFAYVIGNLRYYLYHKNSKLIRQHIKEQIDFRILIMSKFCYINGSCKKCGCTTTKLQMANKSCGKPCYPPIMSKKKWEMFKESKVVRVYNKPWRLKIQGNTETPKVYVLCEGSVAHAKYIKLERLELCFGKKQE